MAGSAAEERLREKAVAAMRRRWPGARICHELNMCGTGSIRLDLAAVETDFLGLVEIKSEKDKLDRLIPQLEAAHRVANAVWLIITIKHAAAVLELAKAGAPTYAILNETLILIENTAGELQPLTMTLHDGRYTLPVGREPARGLFPEPRRQWEMLWTDEMSVELARHAIAGGSNMHDKTRLAVESMTGREIRRAVCRQLQSRRFARADPPIDA